MIVTLTPNPSLDRTLEVDRLERGGVLRTSAPTLQAGGKGVNVTRALTANGVPSIAVLPGRRGRGCRAHPAARAARRDRASGAGVRAHQVQHHDRRSRRHRHEAERTRVRTHRRRARCAGVRHRIQCRAGRLGRHQRQHAARVHDRSDPDAVRPDRRARCEARHRHERRCASCLARRSSPPHQAQSGGARRSRRRVARVHRRRDRRRDTGTRARRGVRPRQPRARWRRARGTGGRPGGRIASRPPAQHRRRGRLLPRRVPVPLLARRDRPAGRPARRLSPGAPLRPRSRAHPCPAPGDIDHSNVQLVWQPDLDRPLVATE